MDGATSLVDASSAVPLQGILASPCHRSRLDSDDRWNSRQPTLRCVTCGAEFHAREGVYDFRLACSDRAVKGSSFDIQWQRHQRGEFEHDILYGADADAELETALDAFGANADDLAGSWILDAGCGSGRLGNSLARLGANIVSLDLADTIRLVARRNRRLNPHYVQADLTNPPFEGAVFDRVWSAGVLHHIAEPRRAFDQLATLVRPGGTLSIWLYSAERFSPFLAIRRILPFVSRMPEPAAAALCRGLAIPLYAAGAAAPLFGRRWLPLATVRFGLYDSLTPRYQSRHREREVRNWFSANGFVRVRKWSQLGLTGERSG